MIYRWLFTGIDVLTTVKEDDVLLMVSQNWCIVDD
jgi:hypothetical protein